MADVTVKRLEDCEERLGGRLRRVRAGLGVSAFGMQVFDLPSGFDGWHEYDRAADEREEVYIVLSGKLILDVDGEPHELEPGVFARVGPWCKRKLITGDEKALVLVVGAIPGRPYQPSESSTDPVPAQSSPDSAT
jgi:quercetin dioxygenase-like cupin family protein